MEVTTMYGSDVKPMPVQQPCIKAKVRGCLVSLESNKVKAGPGLKSEDISILHDV